MIRADGLIARIRDHGLVLSLGILLGVVGHIAWQRVDDFQVGKDPMAYVDVVDDIHPVGASPEAMLQRLDRLTDHALVLDNFFTGFEKGPESLPANAKRVGREMNLPPGDSYRVQGVMTNMLDAPSRTASGSLAVYRFAGLDQTRGWLRQDTQIFVDTADDERRKTYWAGELVVYYSKPQSGTDYSTVIRQWAEEVSDCPGTANDCGVSSTG